MVDYLQLSSRPISDRGIAVKYFCHLYMIVVVLLLLPATTVWSQLDPDPDGIGIYFDQGASIVAATAEQGEFVPAYLIGTNLSQSGDIDFWEAFVIPGEGAMVSGTPYGAFNLAMNMPGDPRWHCVVYWPEIPLPAQPITLLASLHIQVWDDTVPIGLYFSGEERYRIEGTLEEIPLYPSSGSIDLPVAVINGEAPVANESGTWGAVKAMFR